MKRNHLGKDKKRTRWGNLLVGILIVEITIMAVLFLAITPIFFPSAVGMGMADLLRAVMGPQAVSKMESVAFQIQDGFNYLRSQVDGGQVQITLSSQTQAAVIVPTSANTPTLLPALPTSTPQAVDTPLAPVTFTPTVMPNTPVPPDLVVSDPPQLGWQAYGSTVNGQPALARTMLTLDPQRPYAGIALVRIDLSKVQLHMMPGYLEPSDALEVAQAFPEIGVVPIADRANLIAAFNGGFKHIHGLFGMMVSGVTLRAPQVNLATIAIYQNGRIRIGSWGSDMAASLDMLAFRQNCPLLVHVGQVDPLLSTNSGSDVWGFSDNKDITWRTGIGLTYDARYLIYAMGNSTSAPILAEALWQAGSYNAMQLDIHEPYTHFVTYQPVDAAVYGFNLRAFPLLDQMAYSSDLYLTPNSRDFFYLTAR